MLNVASAPARRNATRPALRPAAAAPAVRTPLAGEHFPATSAIVARLLERDGAYHAAGRYYASQGDAALVRRIHAARIRSDAIRGIPAALAEIRRIMQPAVADVAAAADLPAAAVCPWCGRSTLGAETVQLGGREVHVAPCAAQYDVTMGGR